MPGGAERWLPLDPSEVRRILRGLPVPWWIAGGWAVDLFLGRATRSHGDVEIAMLRRDHLALQRALPGWDLRIADLGTLEPWPQGRPLPRAKHGIWAREAHVVDAWQLEIALEVSDGDRWVYRRDARISRDMSVVGFADRGGIPSLRPEIVLLYKSKAPRPRDEADFAALLPRLPEADRRWLASAIATIDAAHPWLTRLRGLI